MFEGFFDLLTALAYFGKVEPDTPVIVMNSAAMYAQTVEAIKRLAVAKVYLYLDRDKTGEEAAMAIREALPGVTVEDRSHLYAGCKDFNEFWMQRQQAKDGLGQGIA